MLRCPSAATAFLLLAATLAEIAPGQTASPPGQPPASPAAKNPPKDNASRNADRLVVTVTDDNGVVVGAARVLLQGPPPSSALRCQTDFTGHCEFSALPAGPFALQVEKPGFYAASLPHVDPTATRNVDVVLSHVQQAVQVVNVQESPPAIDPAQVSAKEELSGSQIVSIPYPGPHDYRNALTFVPGSAPDAFGQFHLAGAATYQMVTMLDGFNVTQPATGQLQVRTSVDSFRSITVEPSREPAEYGKGSGGVLALNTGMGNDRYHFVSTDFIPSFQTIKGLSLSQWTPIYTVSGPVLKGKAWFLDSIDGEYDNNIIPQLQRGDDRDHVWRLDNLAKLQANLTTRNILKLSFLSNYLHDPHSGFSFLSPPETTPDDRETAYIGSVKDQYSFESGTLLETGFGADEYQVALTPAGTAPYAVSVTGNSGNYYENQQTLARRWQGLANLYFAPKHWHGRHDIKLGTDVDRLNYDAQFLRQPISFLNAGKMPPASGTCLTILPSPCARYSTFSGGAYAATNNVEASAYAEDRWLLTNRLLVEPGVRLDWDQIVRSPLFSPRLAATYILDEAGNTKLSAGIGIVYDTTPLGIIAQPLEGQRVDYFFDASGNPVDVNGNPAHQPVPVPSQFLANLRSLDAPRYLNWSLALEKKLPAAVFLKLEFLEKRGVHGLAYNTLNGAVDGDFVLGNSRTDRYDAITVILRHNFRQRYAIYGTYTRSRVHSNEVFDFSVDFPLLTPQRAGPFPWDVPNRFVGWGILPVPALIRKRPRDLDLVYSVEARTGLPFFTTTDQQQLASPTPLRLPAYYSINLAFEKRLHVLRKYWAVRVGFNNLTNHANVAVANGTIDPNHLSPTYIDQAGRAFDVRLRLLDGK